MIGEKSQYKFCLGLPSEGYMKNYEVISFHIKSVQLTDFPFNQIDSMACKLLFKLAHNAMIELLNEVKCSLCKHLMTHLKH